MRRLLLSLPLAATLFAPPALADERLLPFTYQYMTPAEGERELAYWGTYMPKDGLEHQVELEYGVTDHLVFEFYGVAKSNPWSFEGAKFESRYRLAEPGQWPVDVALYGEVEHLFSSANTPTVEAKLILQKDLGPISLLGNLIGEKELSDEKPELRGTGGVVWHASRTVHPGLELVYDHDVLYVGPTVALTFGASKAVAGAYYSTDQWMARAGLEQEF
jgi:hypothetical protein